MSTSNDTVPEPDIALAAACSEVVAAIQRLCARQPGPVLAALDGGSGAGKSTLASRVAGALEVALIPLDDFFSAQIPDAQWDQFTVEERLRHVLDWQRLRESVLAPLRAGQRARWYAFDFASGPRPDGTYRMQAAPTVREPAPVILLEGAYSASPALAGLVDLAILVDVPTRERHARLEAREEGQFLKQWHLRWDAVEAYYFTRVRPPASFDLVVALA